MAAAGVFSDAAGPVSDPRMASLAAFHAGTLSALCVVDLFNEGVDIPLVDRMVMLRPTESTIVFLQQLARGLRAACSTWRWRRSGCSTRFSRGAGRHVDASEELVVDRFGAWLGMLETTNLNTIRPFARSRE